MPDRKVPARRVNPLGGAFESFSVPHFSKVFIGGFLWNISRWGMGFLAAYTVNELTGSPRLVQLTGSFMWAPLLFAGVIGGALSDRFDRRRLVLAQFVLLLPLTVLVGWLALGDLLQVWLVYLVMVFVGVAWVMDMTSRRALIYDLVGDSQINNAMALESMSTSVGLVLGALVGGTVIDWLGIGQAYLVIAGAMALALGVLASMPSLHRQRPLGAAASTFLAEVTEALRALPANLALLSVLGVTVLVNFFHFSYFPMVPVIAKRVDASPVLTGLLAAATGLGMLFGSLSIAVFAPARGVAYVIGSFGAFALLLGFAGFTSYPLVFGSLLAASFFIGWFSSTQSALVMTATDATLRGRAMGLLSMAIGALPIGMYTLGEMAEWFGAPTALVISNVVGVLALVGWLTKRPEAWRTR
jgi:MFS family permease